MVIVLGSVVTREGCVDEALALSREHVARSRQEPGCLSHAVYLDPEHPRRLVFVEEWADQRSLWQHFVVPASRAFVESLTGLAAEPPSMKLFEGQAVEAPGKTA